MFSVLKILGSNPCPEIGYNDSFIIVLLSLSRQVPGFVNHPITVSVNVSVVKWTYNLDHSIIAKIVGEHLTEDLRGGKVYFHWIW